MSAAGPSPADPRSGGRRLRGGSVAVREAAPATESLSNSSRLSAPLEVVVGLAVASLRITEEVEGQEEEAAAGVQAAGGVAQLSLDVGFVLFDGGQLLRELGLRPRRVADQSEVLGPLPVKLGQPRPSFQPNPNGVSWVRSPLYDGYRAARGEGAA